MPQRARARAEFAPTPPQCISSWGARQSWPGFGQDFTRPSMSTLMSPIATIVGFGRVWLRLVIYSSSINLQSIAHEALGVCPKLFGAALERPPVYRRLEILMLHILKVLRGVLIAPP